jgi:hypothetical protein
LNTKKQTYKPVIVIPAFRRTEALIRLLQSVNDAIYPEEGCTLILSIEGDADERVRRLADEFQFRHGEKRVVTHREKLGLKSHIYSCAGYSKEFGSVIVLEDDLIVSPAYYLYAVRALEAYQDTQSVAGISLYAQRFNETAQLPFEPMPSYFAGYFMQLACSWGQAWTADQWDAFQKWINEKPVPVLLDDLRIPKNIREWPAESWKREFNWYLLQKRRTIFYPYQSLTTNSSHYGGENMSGTGSLFDVPLMSTPNGMDNLLFPQEKNAMISYDMFMEADGGVIENITDFKRDEITLDLYGMKPVELLGKKSYYATSRIVRSPDLRFPLLVKPIEANLRYCEKSVSEPFFSVSSSDDLKNIEVNRSGYISLAQFLSYNRTDTKKFIIQNLKQSLKNKL